MTKDRLTAIFMAFAGFSFCLSSQAETLKIGNFSTQGLTDWEEHEFVGNTQYRLQKEGDVQVVVARSSGSASGLFKSVKINLDRTPYLNWRWRVDNVISGSDERSKSGDDYPARIYVVKEGLFPWNTKAVNYVWSNNQPLGSSWPNAYTGNAVMMALQSGSDKNGQWVLERRTVKEDFRKLFGEDISEITTIALMTDTDNTGKQATAYYGDIFFSSE